MDVNFKVKFMWDSDTHIIQLLKNIGIQMATFQEIVEASRAEQDLIVAAVSSINSFIVEVKQLLTQGNVVGAQELLDKIAINSEKLVKISMEGADIAAAVDAVNGEPPVVIEV